MGFVIQLIFSRKGCLAIVLSTVGICLVAVVSRLVGGWPRELLELELLVRSWMQ